MKFTPALLALLLFVPATSADMAPLVSYKTELVNKKYVLVMLYPKANTMNEENPLHKIYAKSGLYLNDGARDPIWTLEDPFQGQVFLSDDGDFMAHVVFPAQRDGDGVRFFHKGKLIRAHKVLDLAHPDSVQDACPSCRWHDKVEFNEAEKKLVLESRDGRIWRFDVETGDVVADPEPVLGQAGGGGTWIVVIVGVILLAFFVVASVLLGALVAWRMGWLSKANLPAKA